MSIKAVPEGFHTITPYFSVRDAAGLVGFLKRAFDAKDVEVMTTPDGTVMHAQLQIGNSTVMLGQVQPDYPEDKLLKAMLYMYVDDVDAVYNKAIKAGGKSVMEPTDQFYGDRSGALDDPAGNQWWIATHIEDVSSEEMMRRAAQRGK